MKKVHDVNEQIKQQEEEARMLDQLVNYLLLQLSTAAISTPLHTRVYRKKESQGPGTCIYIIVYTIHVQNKFRAQFYLLLT